MTGTPIDLTPFGPLLTALGLLYWVLAFGIAALALWQFRSSRLKVPIATLALAVFAYPVVRQTFVHKEQRSEAQARLDASMALFAERCKNAGEKIIRTVDNVEGVVWMKWRDKDASGTARSEQFALNDPYGRDCSAEECIANLLRVTAGASFNPSEAKRHANGYEYVEAVDPKDGKIYRYKSVITSVSRRTPAQIEQYKHNTHLDVGPDVYGRALSREVLSMLSSNYGVVWDDISTREDREHWLAGGSLKIVDLQTNEILGERIGYMIDQGQGSHAGFRSPWLEATHTACPAFPPRGPTDPRPKRDYVNAETRVFSTRVVRPTKE